MFDRFPPRRRRPRPSSARSETVRRRRFCLLGAVLAVAIIVIAVSEGGGSVRPRRSLATVVSRPASRSRALTPAARERAVENAAIDRTLRYTPYIRVAGDEHREIALTFDDGPGPYTPEVLDVLEREHVPGTFFEVGIEERYFSIWTRRIVRDGFPIGDHTETHPPMSELSARVQAAELLDQTRAIGRYGAPFPRLFRPPYALWNRTTLRLLARDRMLMILWTVDTNDYERPGVGAIVASAERGARPGAIILLHDAGGDRSQTVAALPRIIRNLRARGYRLVTVSRLIADNPPPRNQDIVGLTGSG